MGGALSTAALITVAYLDSLVAFTIVHGGLLGVSLGLAYLPTMLNVNLYFDQKRLLAVGIAMSGSCVGIFASAPTVEFLLRNYGLRWTFLVMSGFTFTVALLGFALKSPPASFVVVEDNNRTRRISIVSFEDSNKSKQIDRRFSTPIRPLDRIDVFYRGSIVTIDDGDLPLKATKYNRRSSYGLVHSDLLEEKVHSPLKSFFEHMFDKKVLKNSHFIMFCLGRFFMK